MSFFAVLLALLIEQLKPLPRSNWVFGALIAWMRWTGLNFNAGREHHAWVVWGVTVIAPALSSFGIYLGISHYSLLLALGWNVLVLYLTLGFRQFSHYFTDIRDALDEGDDAKARQRLAEWRHLDASELPSIRCWRRTVTSSVSSSGSSCSPRSASDRPGPCCIAWPSSPVAIGPSGAGQSACPPTSA